MGVLPPPQREQFWAPSPRLVQPLLSQRGLFLCRRLCSHTCLFPEHSAPGMCPVSPQAAVSEAARGSPAQAVMSLTMSLLMD